MTRMFTFASTSRIVDVQTPALRGIDLALADSGRSIHAIVRSTASVPVPNAFVFVVPAKVASMKLAEAEKIHMSGAASGGFARDALSESLPAGIQIKPGDLHTEIANVPQGVASACAIGLARLDATLAEASIQAAAARIDVICVPLAPDATTVTIEVAPMPRLD